ncbi:DNA-binding response regulator [Clostridium botulinum]|uniref:DNA-binding response regulator n=1 Tax=Clostridium botulinum TaxID=1491 RepID=UPI0013FFAF33|nr:DNA-binding response regulator [Clostridium botulinum]MBY6836930.1 DNA-binding response regulator [Clostridium botulinum]NFG59765.1 DNA-binding response regulator [Clostridium botulinum]NFG64893.1 DNA-binding response regulator [Clostridium botulinum]NFQ23558.1 DNA-binding response regulator [Clostridium botulinum]
MLDKIRVKEYYLKGYSYERIASILKQKPETVKKCIQRNLKKFKTLHEAEKIRNKEVQKVLNFENKNFMSDKEFVRRNRSIYTTKLNGDIVIDKKIKVAISWDVPKRLNNENKCII